MVTYERVVSHRCKIKNVQVPLALLYFLLDPAHRGGHSLESPSVTLPRSCCDLILLIVQAGGRCCCVCVCVLSRVSMPSVVQIRCLRLAMPLNSRETQAFSVFQSKFTGPNCTLQMMRHKSHSR